MRVPARPPRPRAPAPAALPAFALAAALATPALAQAPVGSVSSLMNLESNLPAEVEDAEPTSPGRLELQLPLTFDREQDSDNRFVLEPRLQYGIAPRWSVSAGLPLIIGSTDRTNSGNLRGELMFKPIDEGSLIPALAAAVRLEVPTGTHAEGIDTTLKLMATKTLGATPGANQLHLNAAWRNNSQPREGDRRNTGRLILGYSTPLSAQTVLVADLIRGHAGEGGSMSTIAEIGLRKLLTRDTVAAFGIGHGHGDDAPRWRLTAGLQSSF